MKLLIIGTCFSRDFGGSKIIGHLDVTPGNEVQEIKKWICNWEVADYDDDELEEDEIPTPEDIFLEAGSWWSKQTSWVYGEETQLHFIPEE